MWHLGTCFSGGPGIPKLMVGLDGLKGLFYDSKRKPHFFFLTWLFFNANITVLIMYVSLKFARWTILTCISGNIRKSCEFKCGRPQFQDSGLQYPLLLSSSLQRQVTVVILFYLRAKRWVKFGSCFHGYFGTSYGLFSAPPMPQVTCWIQGSFPVCRTPINISRAVVQTFGASVWPLLSFFFFPFPIC